MLINFLREILYLFNGESFVTYDCEIKMFSNKKLTARLAGEPFNKIKYTIKTEIKAVTYSGLSVKKKKLGWKARIIFDV
ncbi:MAG: archease [Syntrophaceae bacterium]|nr:archease [Syntrophaceae bacterium]